MGSLAQLRVWILESGVIGKMRRANFGPCCELTIAVVFTVSSVNPRNPILWGFGLVALKMVFTSKKFRRIDDAGSIDAFSIDALYCY